MLLLAWTLSFSGFTALCLAMERHHRQTLRTVPTAPIVVALRTGGCALLALALAACVASFPGSLGFVVWLGVLTVAAAPLAFALPYAPRAAVTAAACAPFAAALIALASS
jgi:hypothetical protein